MTPSDIAWVAGFLEGEGSFLVPVRKSNSLTVSAPQKDIEPLERLKGIVGGTIHKPCGKNPCYGWFAHGSRAAGIMMTVYAFMSKRRQAKIAEALAVWRTRPVAHKDKTVCIRGHAFVLRKNGLRQGVARTCNACKALRARMKRASISGGR